jgi:hypothetical protein
MQVDGTISYPKATPVEVFEMLADPEFQRRKCAATGAISYEVSVEPAGADTVIACRRTLPTDDLPDFARALVSGGLELVETITWGPAAADGARQGQVELAFVGQPLTMKGTLDLRAAGSGTTAILAAQLVARVPFLGGRIEKACEPLVQKALRIEESVGTTWLATQG